MARDSPNASAPAPCDCSKRTKTEKRLIKWTTAGGVFAAIGVCAACCLLPAALLSIGIAGTWIYSMDALASYKWILVLVALGLLGYGFCAVYRKPKRTCAAGAGCAYCGSDRSLRFGLWVGAVLAIGGIVYGYLQSWPNTH